MFLRSEIASMRCLFLSLNKGDNKLTALGKKNVTCVPPWIQQVQFRGIGEDDTGRRVWLAVPLLSCFLNTNIQILHVLKNILKEKPLKPFQWSKRSRLL